ncbi:hypothetical protein [Catenuloplanes indicus]|uniref:UDP-N-acetylmuramyl pentapeptide synthase n=1 Tax=Catenuloplanes indicus TaxID=137267 RepID=A0AAE3VW15_9ACTN|nr:hypothetical protein [Catenuloplanes indicus]MDQ0364866.1 UDP-N-acetylmuramyl pentapeptide synthase [Catenuloplanes indicus]
MHRQLVILGAVIAFPVVATAAGAAATALAVGVAVQRAAHALAARPIVR